MSGRNPTGAAGVLVFGAPTPPLAIPGVTAPGCLVWADPSALILRAPPSGQTRGLNFPLSNNAALIGIRLRMQSVYNPVPLLLSNGLQVTLGR